MAGTGPVQFMRCSAANPKSLVVALSRCDSLCYGLGYLPAGEVLSNQPVAALPFMISVAASHLRLRPIPPHNLTTSLPLASPSVCFDCVDQPIAPRFTAGPSPMTARSSYGQQWQWQWQWQLFLGCRTA